MGWLGGCGWPAICLLFIARGYSLLWLHIGYSFVGYSDGTREFFLTIAPEVSEFPCSNSAARFSDYLLRSLFYRFYRFCLTRKKETYRLTQYFGLMTLVSFVLVPKLKTE